jgi:tuberous sclerosis protein 2
VFSANNEYFSQEIVDGILQAANDTEDPERRPDPITGYIWSGSAPSQRRKKVSVDPAFMALQISSYPDLQYQNATRPITDESLLATFVRNLDRMPVIDTHKVGIMYVAPGQTQEQDILRNSHGSPAYTRFLEGIGRLVNLRGQVDVYAGGLDPDRDGEYAYAWWDDIGQILYHTATMMPSHEDDTQCVYKKRHIGNDHVRIVWNDSGIPYRFDTLATDFQFVNIVIEPHSLGAIAAFSNNLHENEYFKVNVQLASGMPEFLPIGDFKLISAENLPLLVRQLSLLADWFASVFEHTQNDTVKVEMTTNWQSRLRAIRRFQEKIPLPDAQEIADGVMGQESLLDFATKF